MLVLIYMNSRSIIMPKIFDSAMKRNKFTIAAQQNVNLGNKKFK